MLAPGLVLALLVGCAQAPDTSSSSRQDVSPERVFVTAFSDLRERYIEDLDLGDLVVKGLGSFSRVDPDIGVSRSDDSVVLAMRGFESRSFASPARDDADSWGRLTASVLTVMRDQSERMRAVDSEDAFESIFDSVVGELDSFSRYSSRDEARENRASRDGFGGVGVRIEVIEEGVKIIAVIEDTPAQDAGVKNGDVIVRIDGEAAAGMSQRDVIQRLRGPVGTLVTVDVLRDAQTLEIAITRAHIVPQTVTLELRGNVAVARISSFNHSTADTLRAELLELNGQIPGGLAGVVLDMRANPGGLLDQSVAVSDLFMSQGKIVTTHGRHRDSHQYFSADRYQILRDVPMVILINGSSASASEIVAAALQDVGRAIVVGSTSYGKGTVQTVLTLPNQGELTLTWARFHAPSGYPLHERGVLPDICTSGNDSLDAVLRLISQGRLPLDMALRRATIDDRDPAAVKAFKANCPANDKESAIDLDVALHLLADRRLYARIRDPQSAAAAQ